jgi:D-glycero-alpha-D-manno-heptose 1-phosphate guanylyltransferase
MKAIILLGGFGTRLRSVLSDVPKPMAPIGGKPFLAYLLDYLKSQGIVSVIFSVHFLREQIQTYFGYEYSGVRITYATEDEPLGTGGAIAHSLSFIDGDSPVFVLNGDTFVQLDYRAMFNAAESTVLTMALRAVDDCSRYGKVMLEQGLIREFREKGEVGAGYINAGVYLIQPHLFAHYPLPKQFSFEKDFLFPYLDMLRPRAFIANDYFIDIGIPEDYARAQAELPLLQPA